MAYPDLEGFQGQQNPKQSLSKEPDPITNREVQRFGFSIDGICLLPLPSFSGFPRLLGSVDRGISWVRFVLTGCCSHVPLVSLVHLESRLVRDQGGFWPRQFALLVQILRSPPLPRDPPFVSVKLFLQSLCVDGWFGPCYPDRVCVSAARASCEKRTLGRGGGGGSACLKAVRPGQKGVSAR